MYISYTAHNPNKHGTSSANLVNYLTKEDKSKEQSRFFNGESNDINFDEVTKGIDENRNTRHSTKEASFYMLNIAPSQKELDHIDKLSNDFADKNSNSSEEREYIKKQYTEKLLQEYTHKTMNDYAENFNRDKTVDDLVYYAKIEHERRYKETDKVVQYNNRIDKEIKENPEKKTELEKQYKRNSQDEVIRSGQNKEGKNTHIHVVVSRYEKNAESREKASLSPMSKGRSSKGLNGSKVGFDRDKMNQKAEDRFDETFNYERSYKEKYEELKKEKEARQNIDSEEYKKEKEYKKENESLSKDLKEFASNGKDYMQSQIEDALRSNDAMDSSIPTSLKELQGKIEYELKEELGIENTPTSASEFIKNEISELDDLTNKGIDIGY